MRNDKSITEYYFHSFEGKEEDYLKIVESYIEYYQYRSRKCKRKYYIMNTIKYISLVSVPIIQAIDAIRAFPWLVTIASSICLLIESLLELYKTKDKWILYRQTNSSLMREQREFVTKQGEYSEEDKRYKYFVKNVEELIEEEARKWAKTVETQNKDNKMS